MFTSSCIDVPGEPRIMVQPVGVQWVERSDVKSDCTNFTRVPLAVCGFLSRSRDTVPNSILRTLRSRRVLRRRAQLAWVRLWHAQGWAGAESVSSNLHGTSYSRQPSALLTVLRGQRDKASVAGCIRSNEPEYKIGMLGTQIRLILVHNLHNKQVCT